MAATRALSSSSTFARGLTTLVPGRILAAGLASALLASCVSVAPGMREEPPVTGETAASLGIVPGPAIFALGLLPRDAAAALDSFAESCHVATTREDVSGLTRPFDWQPACRSAEAWPRADAARFFETYFETARVGGGEAFATGYFEPRILGARTRRPGFDVPVFAVPDDLERCWPDETSQSEREGRAPLSRRTTSGACVPYYTRAEIEDGALDGRVPVLGWAADPIEFFFLQIQGSGQLVSPEGEVIRIGYANQNGRGYTGIGAVMRERGLLGEGPGQYAGSMQGIMQYLRENPEEGRALMRENDSWIFFTELTGDGPLGSIAVPVRGESSVAVDPRFVPYGAPVFLSTDRPEARGLWIAQDTGGAIKGANRFDTFWGAGDRAREIAGGMSARGQSWVFLPRGVLGRHTGR